MSDPTRAQISADVTLPTYQVELYLSGSWTDVSSDVLDISHRLETSNDVSGIAFGTVVSPRATVECHSAGLTRSWELTPIRISYGFSSSNKVRRFAGVITGRSRDAAGCTWECRGWDALIEGVEVRSPMFRRRPIATATSLTSIEDPTNGAYAAGIVNYILWQCGGRPYDQAASYPSALWYYACSHAVIRPEWTWIAGENPWQALQRFVRAAGGQLYQDNYGTMRYVDPLTLASGSATFTFTDAIQTAAQRAANNTAGYGSLSDRAEVERSVTGVTCTYVTRIVQGVQLVYEDTQARRLGPAAASDESLAVDLDTQLPLYSVDRVERDAATVRTATPATTGEVTISITSQSSQRVSVLLTNDLTVPVQIDGLRVIGRPIAAGEEGTASYVPGGGSLNQGRVLPLEDSPWVQSARHARQLCRMAYDYYATAGTTITLTDVAYDPDRYVGELVALTNSAWNLSAVTHRIVALRPDGGAFMDVDLTPINGLPTISSVFVVGTSYSGSDSRELSY